MEFLIDWTHCNRFQWTITINFYGHVSDWLISGM